MKAVSIWIDIDNSPHVLIFRPIIKLLLSRKIHIVITAREFAQTTKLLDFYEIPYYKIGRHGGKRKIHKVLNFITRGYQLFRFVRKLSCDIALSHGSRSQLLAAKILGIPSILMLDYEYTESIIFNILATKILMPSVIPNDRLLSANFNLKKLIRYDGFKEELYLKDVRPDLTIRSELNVSEENILVLLRPPGMVGNYHDKRSEIILIKLIEHLQTKKNIKIIVIPRTKEDRKLITENIRNDIHILDRVYDGPVLISCADIFISGGGTMNRESALLGIPTYSIFTGKKPYLDEYLEQIGRLTFINDLEDIKKIKVKKRNPNASFPIHQGIDKIITDIILKNF